MRIIIAFAFVGLAAVACESTDPTVPANAPAVSCALGGSFVSPASASLRVGDTLRVSINASSCGSTSSVPTFHWTSSNASIASVDSLIGLIKARTTGDVTIVATEVVDPTVKGAALVHVTP